MVTLTLIQGVLNTLVILAARIVGRLVDSWMRGGRDNREGGGGIGYFVVVLVLQVVFGLFASIIVAAFSRWREFRADAAGDRQSVLSAKSVSVRVDLGARRILTNPTHTPTPP